MGRERVRIEPDTLSELRAAAAAAWPREMAGILGGRVTRKGVWVTTFVACQSGSPSAFQIPPEQFAAAEGQLRDGDREFLGFVHSHPGGAAHPSQQDLDAAWPGSLHLVLGGAQVDRIDVRAFRVTAGIATPLPLTTSPAAPGQPPR